MEYVKPTFTMEQMVSKHIALKNGFVYEGEKQ